MFKTILKSWLAKQVAQHGSVSAMAVGLVANLLGVPLADTQISALITGISIAGYIWSQIKALHHPPPAPIVAKALLLLVGALAFTPHAHAAATPFSITYPTQTIDDALLDPTDIKAVRIVCDGPTALDVRIAYPALAYTATLALCSGHAAARERERYRRRRSNARAR